MSRAFWEGRSVLVTGHTGFKGSWLVLWLEALGAEIHGYALDPEPGPSLFDCADLAGSLSSDTRADLADIDRLCEIVLEAKPELVFHLAAQPLVLRGYDDPRFTWQTNTMGTVNVLEATRLSGTVRAVVVVTTDKVYEATDDATPHHEEGRLGGQDPYSASKAAAELVTSSFRSSFPTNGRGQELRIAAARAGNVIGGGDWSSGRLVPDCVRALAGGYSMELRQPDAIRPWQHVLDALSGYLLLAERMSDPNGGGLSTCINFGPEFRHSTTVREVAEMVARSWGVEPEIVLDKETAWPEESGSLHLDSSRALELLGWQTKWDLQRAIEVTVAWHKAHLGGSPMKEVCREQIDQFSGEEPDGSAS